MNNLLNQLKHICKLNNITLKKSDFIFKFTNFDKIFTKKGYSSKSINTSKKIYEDYILYMISKLKKTDAGENECKIIDEVKNLNIFDFNNVKDYFDNHTNYHDNTKANKCNNLSRTICILSGKKNCRLPRGFFVEHKKKNDSIINSLIYIDLAQGLLKENDINVILLYQLSFILGLNIGEISRLKFANYDKKRATLKFLRDNKIITRSLNCFTTESINILEKDAECDKNAPLIFLKKNFIDLKGKESYLISKLKDLVNNCQIISEENKAKLINLIFIQRNSRRLNESEIKIFRKILSLNKIIEFNKINDNYINNDYKFEERLAISNIIKIKEPLDIT